MYFAYDVFEISDEVAAQYNVTKASQEEIIRTSDYISLHVPLLDSTRDMISTKEFEMMKDDACLINAARGGIVNEEALYVATV